MTERDAVPTRRASHKDIAVNKVNDDSALKRNRPEAEPFKRKRDGKTASASLRSGRDIQDALASSPSGLSLDAFGDEDRAPVVPVETILANLEPYQPSNNEEVALYGQAATNAELYQQIFGQARHLNYNISDLEVVLVGLKNQGKSSLLQAILGVPLPLGRTRRTFNFHLVNDATVNTPRFLIKEQSKETECTLEQLHSELAKRNRARTEAVTVLVVYKWGFDMTIVDTPAIRSLEELAVWARPAMTGTANRFLVAVESAQPLKDIRVLQWLKHFDPSFERSMLVLTGFENFLSGYQANPSSALFQFADLENSPVFWTTLPTQELSRDCGLDADAYKKRIWQHYKYDIASLRLLDLDYCGNQHQLGVYNFRDHLSVLFQTELNRHIPSLARAFEHTIARHDHTLTQAKEAIDNWGIDNIRAKATTYTANWLRQMDALLKGSVSGEPSKNGQTLQEELLEFPRHGLGDIDTLPFDAAKASVPNANVRLYGAPQLLRLLEEFKITAAKCKMPAIDDTEVMGSVDIAWAASEIARRKIEEQFVPLLDHLILRAFFILKRAGIVCDSVVEQRISDAHGGSHTHSHFHVHHSHTPVKKPDVVSQKNFPAFSTFLRQMFIAAQTHAQQQCLTKCKDEFCSSLTIYWELTDGVPPVDLTKDSAQRMKNVTSVAQGIYNKIKERLIESFVLNVHTYFLTPTAVLTCAKAVAADVATLSADGIRDMFLIEQIKALYQSDIQATTKALTEVKDLQKIFLTKLVPSLLSIKHQ